MQLINTFNTTSKLAHRRKRRIMAKGLSEAALETYEQRISGGFNDLINRLGGGQHAQDSPGWIADSDIVVASLRGLNMKKVLKGGKGNALLRSSGSEYSALANGNESSSISASSRSVEKAINWSKTISRGDCRTAGTENVRIAPGLSSGNMPRAEERGG